MKVKFEMWQAPCGCCFYAEAKDHSITVHGKGLSNVAENIRIACIIHFEDPVTLEILDHANN